MEIKIRALVSFFITIKYKLMYGSRYKSSGIESWGRRMEVHINGADSAVRIGSKCVSRTELNLRAESGGQLSIGDKCFFNTNVSITSVESVKIGNGCQFGNNIVIVDHDHDHKGINGGRLVSSPVVIGDNVWVGANCVILRGVTIGDNAVIAAGSIVKTDVDPGVLVYQKRTDTAVVIGET